MIEVYLVITAHFFVAAFVFQVIAVLNYRSSQDWEYGILSEDQWRNVVRLSLYGLLLSPVWPVIAISLVTLPVFWVIKQSFIITLNTKKVSYE